MSRLVVILYSPIYVAKINHFPLSYSDAGLPMPSSDAVVYANATGLLGAYGRISTVERKREMFVLLFCVSVSNFGFKF